MNFSSWSAILSLTLLTIVLRLPGEGRGHPDAVKIKYIIPFPLDDEDVERRAAQIPLGALGDDTAVECVPVRNSGTLADCHYEALILEMYVTEAGLRAEEEGYDAVVMDTSSDSGMAALRSRLSIPVIGPGIVGYTVAMMLGRRFSVLTMWDRWRYVHEKNFDSYALWPHVASVRSIGARPDPVRLFAGKEDEMHEKLIEEGRKAVTQDGAEVIVLGSTTMHEAGDYLARHLPVPVINPGPVAVKIAEAIVSLGLSHSKIGYPAPGAILDDRFYSLASAT
jgi:allantoin racemase